MSVSRVCVHAQAAADSELDNEPELSAVKQVGHAFYVCVCHVCVCHVCAHVMCACVMCVRVHRGARTFARGTQV